MVEMGVLAPWIFDAARRVGEALGATKVLVFGSYATGEATKRSDLDLLIISSTVEHVPPLERIERALHALGTLPVPPDVIVLTPDELDSRSHTPFVRRICSESKVAYESN